MKNSIFYLLLPLTIFGQINNNDINNHSILHHPLIYSIGPNEPLPLSGGIEATYHPDSIALKENFPFSDYRVLSIYNPKSSPRRIYYYISSRETQTKLYFSYKMFLYLQAKDEKGNWCDINDVENDKYKSTLKKTQIIPNETINVVVKLPHGNYATKLRFKILISSPPDNETEEYIYSNIFSGTIDKLLLNSK
jgi:hypothetical protein